MAITAFVSGGIVWFTLLQGKHPLVAFDIDVRNVVDIDVKLWSMARQKANCCFREDRG
jgi:hypothetical protein